jgi:ketosteroid isomerase-like protein
MIDDADRAAILKLEADWLTALTQGRAGDIRALLADDCVIFPPAEPAAKGADAALAGQAAPGDILNVRISDMEIEGGPAHAWKTARFAMRTQMPDGREASVSGRHLWVLANTGAGWRIAAMSWRLDHR